MTDYNEMIPPCGVFCGRCPNYLRDKNRCPGASIHCINRKCKSIYVCCVEKRGLEYCYECKKFPCSRLKRFAKSWEKYGQDLIGNLNLIKSVGIEKFTQLMNCENK